MRVLAIANQKGGVGKTTTAMNVAACVALSGRPALLIDIDPQGNATTGLGQSRSRDGGIQQALFHPGRTQEALLQTEVEGLDLLPAGRELARSERELDRLPDGPLRLKQALDGLADAYEYVLIDCPPSLGLLPTNALAAADAVVIPIQCEYYAMEGLAQMLELLRRVRDRYNHDLDIDGILFTMYQPGLPYADEVAAEVQRHCADQVYRRAIPRDTLLSEAPSHGQPILDYAPRSLGAHGYVELTKEILAHGA
jgi:chromosome partitioning protein